MLSFIFSGLAGNHQRYGGGRQASYDSSSCEVGSYFGYRHAQPGQLSIAIISFRMGYKMLTQENSNVVLNDTFCHVFIHAKY